MDHYLDPFSLAIITTLAELGYFKLPIPNDGFFWVYYQSDGSFNLISDHNNFICASVTTYMLDGSTNEEVRQLVINQITEFLLRWGDVG